MVWGLTLRSKENKQDGRPRQTTSLEQLHILRKARGLRAASAYSPREAVAGFRGILSASQALGGAGVPSGSKSASFSAFFCTGISDFCGKGAFREKEPLTVTEDTLSCLLGCRLGWMALGKSSQEGMPLGKGSPWIGDGRKTQRGRRAGCEEGLGLEIKLRTDDWSASS